MIKGRERRWRKRTQNEGNNKKDGGKRGVKKEGGKSVEEMMVYRKRGERGRVENEK